MSYISSPLSKDIHSSDFMTPKKVVQFIWKSLYYINTENIQT